MDALQLVRLREEEEGRERVIKRESVELVTAGPQPKETRGIQQ